MEDITADSFTLFHLIQPKIGESAADFNRSSCIIFIVYMSFLIECRSDCAGYWNKSRAA